MSKKVVEEWSFFNRAVEARAAGMTYLPARPVFQPVSNPPRLTDGPQPTVQHPVGAATGSGAQNQSASGQQPFSLFRRRGGGAQSGGDRPPSPGKDPLNPFYDYSALGLRTPRAPGTDTGLTLSAAFALLLAFFLFFMLVGFLTRNSDRPLDPQSSVAPASAPSESVVTNYTTFHRVPFREGAVVTGWNYVDSRATLPDGQYCYYVRANRASSVDYKFDLQTHGSPPLPYPADSTNLDLSPAEWRQAQAKCHWATDQGAGGVTRRRT